MQLCCDVCEESDAAIFCSADKAALCGDCNGHVHRANELASRHQRFSLVLPLAQDVPPCDNSQERRAFMFCQQDRAILCGECNLSAHTGNEETLPGWQVDELLESCSASSGTFKNGGGSVEPLDMGISNLDWSRASRQSLGFWVPHAAAPPPGLYRTKAIEKLLLNPSRETNVVMGTRNHRHNGWNDDGFTVPLIGPAVFAACKRNRTTSLH